VDKGKDIYYGSIVAGVLLMLALCWFVLGGCWADVHNHGVGVGDVGGALERVGDEQQNTIGNLERIGRGVDASIERADAIADGINEAESRVESVQSRGGECAGIISDSERRITESIRILQSVRSRAQAAGESA